ncbi:MAG: hypothetical protein ABIP54_03515 [Candidatus Andersenbacteria bacterium]
MNMKVVGGIIAGIIALVGIGFGVWYVFLGGSSPAQVATPSPVPTDSTGLPVGSMAPNASVSPIAFRGVCPDTWVGQKDTDGDGLPDSVEAIYGTGANTPDTDGDGYNDGAEVRTGHDPLNPNSSAMLDSDHDGLTDNVECGTWHTDPFNPDSDGDGFPDGAEVKAGFDPTKKGDGRGSDRLPTPTPDAMHATPLPTYSPNNNASPTPAGVRSTPVATPATNNTNTGGGVSVGSGLQLIPLSDLNITTKTSPADMKAYLASIDSLRPQELSDGTTIVNAITSASQGNVAPLTAARTRIQQFASALKSLATPQNASQYHQLYTSMIDFMGQKLLIIEQNASSNQAVASQALLAIQNTLPSAVSQLTSLRQAVDAIANGQ